MFHDVLATYLSEPGHTVQERKMKCALIFLCLVGRYLNILFPRRVLKIPKGYWFFLILRMFDWILELFRKCEIFYFLIFLNFCVFTPLSAEYPDRTTDHGQVTGKRYLLRLSVECTLFCNLQSRARTHVVLVIGLYELLVIQLPNSLSHPSHIRSTLWPVW